MRQFFVTNKDNQFFYLSKEDIKHAVKVLRLTINCEIICVYENQKYLCQISKISPVEVKMKIIKAILTDCSLNKITVFFSLTKQKIWNLLVEKLTELGCNTIIPVCFDYTQQNEKLNFCRLNKISKVAAQQSNRVDWIKFEQPIKFDKMTKILKNFDLIIFGDERKCVQLKNNFWSNINFKNNLQIAAIIGPSGGFSENEFKFLDKNAISLKLSNNILRSETAAITILNYLFFIKELNQ